MPDITKTPVPVAYGLWPYTLNRIDKNTSRSYELPPSKAMRGEEVMSHNPEGDMIPSNGAVVKSTTSIIDRVIRNHGLEIWNRQHIATSLKQNQGSSVDDSLIETVLSSATQEAQHSAGIGQTMHSIIEGLLNGQEVALSEQLEPAATAFLRFQNLKEQSGWKFLSSETAVWNYEDNARYAGTIDCLYQHHGDLIIVDWKTSSGLYESAYLQLASYIHALQQMIENNTWLSKKPRVSGYLVRFINYYPRSDGRKDRTQEKIFEDKLEISAVDPDIWYPRFLSCCDLLTLPSLVRSAGVETI